MLLRVLAGSWHPCRSNDESNAFLDWSWLIQACLRVGLLQVAPSLSTPRLGSSPDDDNRCIGAGHNRHYEGGGWDSGMFALETSRSGSLDRTHHWIKWRLASMGMPTIREVVLGPAAGYIIRNAVVTERQARDIGRYRRERKCHESYNNNPILKVDKNLRDLHLFFIRLQSWVSSLIWSYKIWTRSCIPYLRPEVQVLSTE